MEMEIGLGVPVTIVRDTTVVGGVIDGIKLSRNGVERLSIEGMDYWFWLSDGWQLLVDEEESENGQIQPE